MTQKVGSFDDLEVAANLETSSLAWRRDASLYLGWRREWRLKKAEELMTRAWSLIE